VAGLKILVVDDNQESCENVKDVLELFGYKATTAFDGYNGLNYHLLKSLKRIR